MVEPIGFIMTRSVQRLEQNSFWNHACLCIRKFYPTVPIHIIDDNSNSTMVKALPWIAKDSQIRIVPSKFPKAGEILPYEYLYRERPFQKAVILHDSMFLQSELPIEDVKNIHYIWSFDAIIDYPNIFNEMIGHLKIGKDITQMVASKAWKGCFGVASIMDIDFLTQMHDQTGFLDLTPQIHSKADRCTLERIFAFCVQCTLNGKIPAAICGSIHSHIGPFHYTFPLYQEDLQRQPKTIGFRKPTKHIIHSYPIVKVWSGR